VTEALMLGARAWREEVGIEGESGLYKFWRVMERRGERKRVGRDGGEQFEH
jgi:hypothetical protein